MEEKIDKFFTENEEFRLWLTCTNGLDIQRMSEFESWCEKEGYKEGARGNMARQRWNKHWIRKAKMVTGALPSET